MLIRKKVIRTDEPPVVVNHTTTNREVIVDRDPPLGLIAAICGVVLLVAGLIGYYSWWAPNRTDVVVETQPSVSQRAQTMEAPEPPQTTIVTPPSINVQPPTVNVQPPVIVNPPSTHTKETVIIERERQNNEEVPPPNTSGTQPPTTGTTSGQ